MGIRTLNNSVQAFLDTFIRSTIGAGGGVIPPPINAISATGGVVNDYVDGSTYYRSHTFYASGPFIVNSLGDNNELEYIVVGGGGGAGSGYYSAGGGGGGFVTNLSSHPLSNGTPLTASVGPYTITVGAGGDGGGSPGAARNPGSNSIISGIATAYGGGAGGSGASPPAPNAGDPSNGSGGGGAYSNGSVGTGGPGGNDGGAGTPTGSGGGGGAGGAGSSVGSPAPAAPVQSNGGLGAESTITGFTTFYAAGGAGTFFSNLDGLTTRASGVGGRGATDYTSTQTQVSRAELNAVVNTGSGGGGIDQRSTGYNGSGSGSSGVVVIRYQIGSPGVSSKATGGYITFSGGKTIHIFLNSGTFYTNTAITNADLLAVGGGGGGSDRGSGGGGGGAGGLVYGTSAVNFSALETYTITVGGGGLGATENNSGLDAFGQKGGNTTISGAAPFVTITAYGGGGAGYPGAPATITTGGSGGGQTGGGGGPLAATQPGTNTPNYPALTDYGNPGGSSPSFGGSGGGGAGAAGGSYPGPQLGGEGIVVPIAPAGTGTPGPTSGRFFAGGGGAGGPTGNISGGAGGGGAGWTPPATPGINGAEGTGGGGGGGNDPPEAKGGNGGSGIVIIAYPT